jgi:hypothetical protein
MIAPDTVVAERIAAHARAQGQRALLIAGEHEYDVRLEGQLRLAGLPRGDDVWLCAPTPPGCCGRIVPSRVRG